MSTLNATLSRGESFSWRCACDVTRVITPECTEAAELYLFLCLTCGGRVKSIDRHIEEDAIRSNPNFRRIV